MIKFHLGVVLALLLVFTDAEAKPFSTQFMEFQLPNGWDCALEGSEWVCQSENQDRKKEAIIILAAKYRNEQDSLEQYQAHLRASKTFQLPGGKTQVSEAKSTTLKEINSHRWVDALHLASEVPGFYTRYLATVKDTLGVAITFSVAKDHYDAYQDIFEKIIATLKVFDQKGNQNANWRPKGKESDLLGDGTYIPDTGMRADIGVKQASQKSDATANDSMLLIIIAAAAAIFALIKLRNKKGKKSIKKKK